jgi:hypothetical protein
MLRESDRERFVTAIAVALRKNIEHAKDLNEVVEIWKSGMAAMSAAGIVLSSENSKDVCSCILQRVDEVVQGGDDITKLHQLFDMIHASLSESQKRQFAVMTAAVVCTAVEDVLNPQEILKEWKRKMQQLLGEESQIPFLPGDFDPIVLRLAEAWKETCSESMVALKGVQDFKAFQRVVNEESVRLKEKFGHQEEEIHQLTRCCPPAVRDRLDGLLKATMGGAISSLYQNIQQKVLLIVLPDIAQLKSREDLITASSNLHLLKASLEAFSLQTLNDDEVRSHNEICQKMIDESLKAVEGSLRQLPPPAPPAPQPSTSTTHVLSHNSITINGVAQSAMMGAIAMYAAPALMHSFGVTGMATTIALTVAAPVLINIGTSIVTPIGSFIDRQCDRLPDKIRTPMKYVWRVGLTAAAIYTAHKIYQGWSATVVTAGPPEEKPQVPQASVQQKIEAARSVEVYPSLPLQKPSQVNVTGVPLPSLPPVSKPSVKIPSGVASVGVGGAWTPQLQGQYEAAVAAGKGQRFLDTLQASLGYTPPPVMPSIQKPSQANVTDVVPPTSVVLSVPPTPIPSSLPVNVTGVVSPPPVSEPSVPIVVPTPTGVASVGVGGAWTPQLQGQYEAAVAAGKGQRFLDTLQASLGYTPPPVMPSIQKPSQANVTDVVPPTSVVLSVPPTPIPSSLPVNVTGVVSPPPVSEPSVPIVVPTPRSWYQRISDAFFRGQQQMKESHQSGVQSLMSSKIVGGGAGFSTPIAQPVPSSTYPEGTTAGPPGIPALGQVSQGGSGHHVTKL